MTTDQTSAGEVELDETTLEEVVSRIREGSFYDDYDWASGALRVLNRALTADREGWMRGVETAAGLARANAAASEPLMKGFGSSASVERGRHRAGIEIADSITALPYSPPSHAATPIETCGLAWEEPGAGGDAKGVG